MKLSIVIICWNDREDILACIRSVLAETKSVEYEVVVTDNGSTDGSLEAIRSAFPNIIIVENGHNLGFGGANNQGFRVARGQYVLILNPDTIVRRQAIEKLVAYADCHPDAGAFGCRMLNADGSYQASAHPMPTVRSCLIAATYMRWAGRFWPKLTADSYVGWDGTTEREIGFQAGCCLLIRGPLLKSLKGFDERLFFQTEDADLCLRVYKTGSKVLFYPEAEVTHIGGQNRGRYPLPVVLETQRSYYRFFYKHYGMLGAKRLRIVLLIRNGLRWLGYGMVGLGKKDATLKRRVELYRALVSWHWNISPSRFIATGEEPPSGCQPLSRPPDMVSRPSTAS